jgi:hypothetical protein
LLSPTYNIEVLLGKSVGILSSPLLLQLTSTPTEASVQLQTLGHDDTAPTSKITATIAVIRNSILRRQSTNTVPFWVGVGMMIMYIS